MAFSDLDKCLVLILKIMFWLDILSHTKWAPNKEYKDPLLNKQQVTAVIYAV